MKRYDAGLLNNYGGGSTDWWFDYIRKLLDDAHEFYEEQNQDLTDQLQQYIIEEAGEDW